MDCMSMSMADTCSYSAKYLPNNSQKNNYSLVQLKVLKPSVISAAAKATLL